MTANLQRSLLIGGAALLLGIWVLDLLHHILGEWGIYGLLAGGIGFISWRLQEKSQERTALSPRIDRVDSAMVKQTLAEAEQVITQIQAEAKEPEAPVIEVAPQVFQLQSQVSQIVTEMQREEIRLVVIGGKSSGKSVLIQQMQTGWAALSAKAVKIHEAVSFSGASEAGLTAETTAIQQAIAADLVLFLITGDLTESELASIRQLVGYKRTLLVLNKQDQYLPEDRQMILTRVQERVQGMLPGEDVVAIAAAPSPIKVRQHQPNGSIKEWTEDRVSEIAPLTERLDQILQQESQKLVLASSFVNARVLKGQAQRALNDVRRTRALPTVEQYQWIAAATAFASPVPTLDVLATAAINAQMILDLGKIYRQKFSMQQAQKMAATLGSLMLKLGLVELSTRAIASLFKTNAITYVAGGCIQAASAAYLTRMAGLSLIEYFHSQQPNLALKEASPLAIEQISEVLQSVFQKNQQTAFLQTFVQQAIDRLISKSQPVNSTSSNLQPPNLQPLVELEIEQLTQAPQRFSSSSGEPHASGLPLQDEAQPLTPLALKPLKPTQEIEILDQNRSSIPLTMTNLESTSASSP